MNDSERAPYSAGAWAVGWVTFLGSGYAASVLLSNAWHDCDIGINASANLGDLVMASTSMAMASTLLWGLMRKVTGRRQLLLPLLMTVAAAAALLWPLLISSDCCRMLIPAVGRWYAVRAGWWADRRAA
ncbi:hypothetical protein ACFYWH_26825, partial [Streptomyces sp. NPDC003737]|uniref:hypothetical protein n=1 Tax=Streptomyces sp. NPDC003737 TaxID=3364685 RepID=UPI003693E46E